MSPRSPGSPAACAGGIFWSSTCWDRRGGLRRPGPPLRDAPRTQVVGPFLPTSACSWPLRVIVNVRLGLYSRSCASPAFPTSSGSSVPCHRIGRQRGFVLCLEQPYRTPRRRWAFLVLLADGDAPDIAILGGERFVIRAAVTGLLVPGRASSGRSGAPCCTGLAGPAFSWLGRPAQSRGWCDTGRLPRRRSSTRRQIVAGLSVFGGRAQLAGVADLTGARMLLITMPSAPGHDPPRRGRGARPRPRVERFRR